MKFHSVLLLLVSCSIVHAENVVSVKVGEAEIKLPNPEGTVDVPKDSLYDAALNTRIPPGFTCLKKSIASGLLVNPDQTSSDPGFMSYITYENDMTDSLSDSEFKQVILKLEQQFPHGVIATDSKNTVYAECKKRLAEIIKKSGLTVTAQQPPSNLGIALIDDQFVSFLMTNSATLHKATGDIQQHGFIILSYLHVKQKLLMVTTVRSNDTVAQTDMDILKNTTEKYLQSILALNKPESP